MSVSVCKYSDNSWSNCFPNSLSHAHTTTLFTHYADINDGKGEKQRATSSLYYSINNYCKYWL